MVAVGYTEKNSGSSLKFLCSYGGRILPRSTDGKLRYVGGHTRVLSVDRSVRFSDLMKKLCEFCGYSVDLKCQLPNGDLETLISVKSEEELANIVEEYDRISGAKIRAVLSPPRSSPSSSGDRSPKSPFSVTPSPPNSPSPAYGRYIYNLGIVYLPRILFLEDSIIDRKNLMAAMRVVYTKTLGPSGIDGDWNKNRIYAI